LFFLKDLPILNLKLIEAINKAAEPWGIVCLRYEIRDMKMPQKIQEAMQVILKTLKKIFFKLFLKMQVEAERKKRAAILESEGHRDAAINIAEGEKQACILGKYFFVRIL